MTEIEELGLLHLLLRYSDNFAPEEGTIDSHLKINKKFGYVWLGKFGKTVGSSKKERFINQIKNKKDCFVFLVPSGKKSESIFIARFVDINRSIDMQELSKVPAYYRDKTKLVGIWLKIDQFWEADRPLLRRLYGTGSGMPVNETLDRSMAGMFYVKIPDDFIPTKFGAKKL